MDKPIRALIHLKFHLIAKLGIHGEQSLEPQDIDLKFSRAELKRSEDRFEIHINLGPCFPKGNYDDEAKHIAHEISADAPTGEGNFSVYIYKDGEKVGSFSTYR